MDRMSGTCVWFHRRVPWMVPWRVTWVVLVNDYYEKVQWLVTLRNHVVNGFVGGNSGWYHGWYSWEGIVDGSVESGWHAHWLGNLAMYNAHSHEWCSCPNVNFWRYASPPRRAIKRFTEGPECRFLDIYTLPLKRVVERFMEGPEGATIGLITWDCA
ncbi:hypothetical protein GOBAR_DD25383 [Gossypium barbadense]|nr:hypothetical protein GOBAR_DD25383 [Gossypium barbadense]